MRLNPPTAPRAPVCGCAFQLSSVRAASPFQAFTPVPTRRAVSRLYWRAAARAKVASGPVPARSVLSVHEVSAARVAVLSGQRALAGAAEHGVRLAPVCASCIAVDGTVPPR